jgi:hypothetical protein
MTCRRGRLRRHRRVQVLDPSHLAGRRVGAGPPLLLVDGAMVLVARCAGRTRENWRNFSAHVERPAAYASGAGPGVSVFGPVDPSTC